MTSVSWSTTHDFPQDAELSQHLKDADLPSLLAVLAYLTGDLGLLREEFRPDYVSTPLGYKPQGGLSEEAQERLRDLAFDVIKELQQGGLSGDSHLPASDVRQIMEFMLGPFSDDYFPLFQHHLALPVDADTPKWRKSELAPDRDFTVAIIGAGMAGIAAAYRLKQAEVPFVILERHDEVGGVWSENTYPGCHLDTSNSYYSYSFAQNPSYKELFSGQPAVLAYLKSSAEKFELQDDIRFNTEVVEGRFDENDCSWLLTLKNSDGDSEPLRVDAVISAVGQLNQPNYPNLPNADAFTGESWHTARWNHDVDLTGKRVGVIGVGSSAFQAIQQVATTAKEVTVFQRNAPWITPTPGYNSLVKPGRHWLFENLPHYHRWFRVSQFWAGMSRRAFAEVDPKWDHSLSVSEKNESLRQAMLAYLEESFRDRPDLLEKMTPNYPPYAKRILRDDGSWIETLKRDNVKLVTEGIKGMAESGIEVKSGTVHEFDVLIYGTGFTASDFLSSISLTGRGGIDLHEQWDDDARAYYGITIPNFPNLFCLYGPNTNINANASILVFLEAGVNYILDGLRILLESKYRAMEVRSDVFDAYNEREGSRHAELAAGQPGVLASHTQGERERLPLSLERKPEEVCQMDERPQG